MTDYYINSATGSDGDTGLIGHPWQTFQNLNDMFKNGLVNPGDRFLLEGTWYADYTSVTTKEETTLRLRGSSGTSGNPIVILPTGTGAILDGNSQTGTGALIYAWEGTTPANYITVQDLEFQNLGDGGSVVFIANGSTNWLIDNLYIHDNGYYAGIAFEGGCSDCIIQNCNIVNHGGEGVYIGKHGTPGTFDHDITILNNTFNNCNEGIDIKGDTYNITIKGNILTGCGNAVGTRAMIIGGTDHKIINNEVRNTVAGADGGIVCGYWNDIAGGKQGAEHILIEGNLLDNAGGGGYGIDLDGKNITVVNNTIVNEANGGIYLTYESDTTIGNNHIKHFIYNNAFYNNTYDVYAGVSTSSKYDADYNSYDGTADVWYWLSAARAFAYVTGTLGYEANGITGAQGFVDTTDFELTVGSNLVDAGDPTFVTEPYTGTDPDIGWYETPAEIAPQPAGAKMGLILL